jgi:hypothetical protein
MVRFEEARVVVDEALGEQTSSPQYKLTLIEGALMTLRVGLRSTSPELRRSCREVERWMNNRESDSPFSFESICTTVGVDPAYIRLVLKQLKRHAIRVTDPRRHRVPTLARSRSTPPSAR